MLIVQILAIVLILWRLTVRPSVLGRTVILLTSTIGIIVIDCVILELLVRPGATDRSCTRTRVQPALRVGGLLLLVQNGLCLRGDRVSTLLRRPLIGQNFTGVEHLVEDFVEGLVPGHKLIVEL